MENPLHSAHAILARLLAALDIPDCGCPLYDRCAECGAVGPCIYHCAACEAECPVGSDGKPLPNCPGCGLPLYLPVCDRRRKKPDPTRQDSVFCTRRPCPREHQERRTRPACIHVRARDHDTPPEEWQALLWASSYEDYAQPDQAVFPTACLPGSPGKVEAMAQRREYGVSLWHQADGEPTVDALDSEGLPVSRRKNGSIERGDLRQQKGARHAG